MACGMLPPFHKLRLHAVPTGAPLNSATWGPNAVCSICEAARFYAKLHKTNMYGQPWPNEPWWTPRMYYCYGLGVSEEQIKPSFIVDITAQWDEKLEALACYESQPGPIKQSWRGEEYYGKLIGVDYGEPLFSKEAIGVHDLAGLV